MRGNRQPVRDAAVGDAEEADLMFFDRQGERDDDRDCDSPSASQRSGLRWWFIQ
jgi:hypothetical protein